MLKARGVAIGTAAVLALVLGACTEPRRAPPVAMGARAPATETPAVARGRGIYKVGTPYQIAGTWYYPAEDFGYTETGVASWYGEDFHGKDTANGEVYDLNALTAAHRTLPMPSIVQVTNLENGRSLQLRVNDRGPFARGRIIDVSRRAAQLLGFEQKGTALVRVSILVPESIQVAGLARRNGDPERNLAELPQAAPRDRVVVEPLAGAGPARPPAQPATQGPPPSLQAFAPPPPPLAAPAALPERVSVVPVRPTRIFVQAGAFAQPDSAMKTKVRLEPVGNAVVSGVRVNGVDLYRVRLGPIASVDEADRVLARLVELGLGEARIVVE